MLRSRQHGVEHGSASVGVDLDQSEMPFTQMKVIAEEGTERPARAQPCDGWRGVQHLLPIGRKSHHRFNGLHHLRHAMQLRRRNEYGQRCEEERTALPDHLREAGLAQFQIECARQGFPVQTETEARAVQGIDSAAGRFER